MMSVQWTGETASSVLSRLKGFFLWRSASRDTYRRGPLAHDCSWNYAGHLGEWVNTGDCVNEGVAGGSAAWGGSSEHRASGSHSHNTYTTRLGLVDWQIRFFFLHFCVNARSITFIGVRNPGMSDVFCCTYALNTSRFHSFFVNLRFGPKFITYTIDGLGVMGGTFTFLTWEFHLYLSQQRWCIRVRLERNGLDGVPWTGTSF